MATGFNALAGLEEQDVIVEVEENEEVDLGAEMAETSDLFAQHDNIIAGNESASDLHGLTGFMLEVDEPVSGKEALAVKVLAASTANQYGYAQGSSPVVTHESDSNHTVIRAAHEGAKEMLQNGFRATGNLITKLVHAIKKLYIKIAKKIRKFSKRLDKAKEILNKASDSDVAAVEVTDSKLKTIKKSLVGLLAVSGANKLNDATVNAIGTTMVKIPEVRSKYALDVIKAFKDVADRTDNDAEGDLVVDINGVTNGSEGEMNKSDIDTLLAGNSEVRRIHNNTSYSSQESSVIGNTNTGIIIGTSYIENGKLNFVVTRNAIEQKVVQVITNLKGADMPTKTTLIGLVDAAGKIKMKSSSDIGDKLKDTSDKISKTLEKKFKNELNVANLIAYQRAFDGVSRGLLKMSREMELTKYTNVGNILALVEYYTGKVKKETKKTKKSGNNSDESTPIISEDFMAKYNK